LITEENFSLLRVRNTSFSQTARSDQYQRILNIMMHVQLPERSWITLSEAVTAFVYGESRDASGLHPTHDTDILLEKLHDAALAGSVRFRALKIGNNNYQAIDLSYFSARREFNWNKNEIQCCISCHALDDYHHEGEYDAEFALEWHNVHVDREQFASLLRDMGVSVEPSTGYSDAPNEPKIYKTGLQGRPTAIKLALKEARSRLDAGDYPKTKEMFSEQVVDAVAKAEPEAPTMTPKALRNNPEFTELWRRRRPK
jgi:hypothetical protein